MALVNVNNVPVIAGTVNMPHEGIWSADLVIDQPDGNGFDAGTNVTIAADGGLTWKGVVVPDRAGAFLDAVHVRVLGGANGMTKTASKQGYIQPQAFVKDVIKSLCDTSGETLSNDTDQTFLNTNLVAWATFSQTITQALEKLIDINAPSMIWRILADGTLWIGPDNFSDNSATFDLLEQNPEDGTTLIGSDAPFATPGMSLSGIGKVVAVQHQIMRDKIRARIWTQTSDGGQSQASSIRAIARLETAPLDYYALYQCQVVAQSSDLTTVDVQPTSPNDARIPGLQSVPVRAGSATKVQFVQGAKVLLGWDGGDPSLPYVCCGLSSDSVQRIKMAGNKDAARKGDGVGNGTLTFSGSGSSSLTSITITYQPGDANQPVQGPSTITPAGPGATFTLYELITSGSSKVGIGD